MPEPGPNDIKINSKVKTKLWKIIFNTNIKPDGMGGKKRDIWNALEAAPTVGDFKNNLNNILNDSNASPETINFIYQIFGEDLDKNVNEMVYRDDVVVPRTIGGKKGKKKRNKTQKRRRGQKKKQGKRKAKKTSKKKLRCWSKKTKQNKRYTVCTGSRGQKKSRKR